MKCEGCDLDLPPGAAHLNADGCVAALKHALEQATTCQQCRQHVPVVAHAGCFVRIVQARAGNAGIGILEQKAVDWLKRQIVQNEPRGGRDEDSDPPEDHRRGGGKRFVP